MDRRWVGRMWFLQAPNGLASSVDGRLQSAVMFKNEYWFRVVSVPDMHETSGFRHRSRCQNPNRMATAVKWRHTSPTASEDDEKTDTTEDEKTSTGLTTTVYFRRTWQRSMWFNGKIVSCRAFEQDLSPTSNNGHYVRSASTGAIGISSPNYNTYVQEHIYWRDSAVSCKGEYRFFRYFTDTWNIHQQDDFIFRNVYSLF
jgi:hypothetical protein